MGHRATYLTVLLHGQSLPQSMPTSKSLKHFVQPSKLFLILSGSALQLLNDMKIFYQPRTWPYAQPRPPFCHPSTLSRLSGSNMHDVWYGIRALCFGPRWTCFSPPILSPTTQSSIFHSAIDTAEHRHRLAREYTDLLVQARKLPGFGNFLMPPSSIDLAQAARNGPVVVINCEENNCDALLIVPGRLNVTHIPLPNFTGTKAQRIRLEMENSSRSRRSSERGAERRPMQEEELGFENILSDLWYDIVNPVLDFLGYTKNTDETAKNVPHITWCPTGAVSFLPLHAAGDYNQPQSRVFDHVISSYTPTLTALLGSSLGTLNRDSRVLVVGQEATPGHQRLPGTVKELECVTGHLKGRVKHSELLGSQATTVAVLDAMEQHDWVHLACHAHQNVQNPTESGFFLHDGTLNLESINRRFFKNKGLAFLSACQTATGDEKLPDEAIHLASGMLMSGYSSVIATMWSVYDDDAPLVADKVYGRLMKDGKLGSGEAGKALHYAVAELRDKVGEKNFSRWVPYIHIGS
ncbi:CHAT domain-containing protein [Rhizoctonia solani AG-1 IA]|uniref:CHAT domain-containing protein n=1 Tax=Thanatephorus cucumeris (strain AG1-IA) TaxID=983506 RepID=L8WQT6_THACA|nr:CHAT domain-containing protein [Rhizoctonia solani AG-1 IA]